MKYFIFFSKESLTNITKYFVENNIKICFSQNIYFLNKIEILGIWGYENYDITILTEKEQVNINNIKLFNGNSEKLSLITLEI